MTESDRGVSIPFTARKIAELKPTSARGLLRTFFDKLKRVWKSLRLVQSLRIKRNHRRNLKHAWLPRQTITEKQGGKGREIWRDKKRSGALKTSQGLRTVRRALSRVLQARKVEEEEERRGVRCRLCSGECTFLVMKPILQLKTETRMLISFRRAGAKVSAKLLDLEKSKVRRTAVRERTGDGWAMEKVLRHFNVLFTQEIFAWLGCANKEATCKLCAYL